MKGTISIGFVRDSQKESKSQFHFKLATTNGDMSASEESSGSVGGETPEVDLTEEDWKTLSSIFESNDGSDVKASIVDSLPDMHPRVILALRDAAQTGKMPASATEPKEQEMLRTAGKILLDISDKRLEAGRDLLQTLLRCGELRKLDSAIGKAQREGKLDAAFFNVLSLNLQDAAKEEQEGEDVDEASRYQILNHIYTRCQEEVEKIVSPGAGLLNKLLRTDMKSIRTNQLQHYLCPQKNTITSPDGKTIKLKGEQKVLVPPEEFIEAIKNAVQQIRTVEKSGGADRATAAGLVESCRQIAIEARFVIAEEYGADNEVLRSFEQALQPVFRPDSAESEYIKGK